MIREIVQAKLQSGRRAAALTFLVSLCAIFFAACGGETTNTTNTSAANRNQSAAPTPTNQNSAASVSNANQAATTATGKNPVAVIDTDAGAIKVELLPSEAPVTVDNFIKLAQRGYYNNVIFHRIVSGFMIQGGDPTGTGAGGQTASGQPLPNEIKLNSPLYQGGYRRGAIAMANKGRPETGSSQFFIMHADRSLSQLQPNYTIFGRVIEGMNAVDKIATAPATIPPNGQERSRPITPVKIKTVTIQ